MSDVDPNRILLECAIQYHLKGRMNIKSKQLAETLPWSPSQIGAVIARTDWLPLEPWGYTNATSYELTFDEPQACKNHDE